MPRNKLVETFIEANGDDAEKAIDIINAAMGTRHPRRKIIEWRNTVTALPRGAADVMRWYVINAVLDEDVAEQLCPMLDIHPPETVDEGDTT